MTGNGSNRLRILALCPQTPCGYNAGGGATRSYFLLRHVAGRHALSLALLDRAPVPRDLEQACETVYSPPAPEPGRARRDGPSPSHLRTALANAVRPQRLSDMELLPLAERNCYRRSERQNGRSSLLHGVYARMLMGEVSRRYRRRGLRPARGVERVQFFEQLLPTLLAAHDATPFDCVWVEHTYMLPEAVRLLNRWPKAALVIDSHNVEWLLHERVTEQSRSRCAHRWMRLQTAAMWAVEANGVTRAAATLCCSKTDAKLIRSMVPDAGPVTVVENGVDTDFYQPGGTEEPDPVVTYVGSYGYEPNRDAVRYFHAEIWPILRTHVPQSRFRIVGFQAESAFGHVARNDPHVEIASNVPDIREEFAHCQVVVVPLRAGSGTRFKIIEAMAMGKPVVSTTLGAEGLDASNGENIALADAPGPFADSVAALLRDPLRRATMGEKARAFALERYDWDRITAKVDGCLERAIPR